MSPTPEDEKAQEKKVRIQVKSASIASRPRWSDAPSFIAAVGAISVALSVSWQLGFFIFLDPNLLALFSVADTLQNSLTLVPITLISWALGSLAARMRLGATKFKRSERKTPGRDIRLALITFAFLLVFVDLWPLGALILSFEIYFAAIALLRQRGLLSDLTIEITFGCLLIAQAFLLGVTLAQVEIHRPAADYELTLASGDTATVNLLKTTTDTFVLTKKPHELLILPRSQVASLTKKYVEGPQALIPLAKVLRWARSWYQEQLPSSPNN